MLKRKPGAKPNKKSLIAPPIVRFISPTDPRFGEYHEKIKHRIMDGARAIVVALSQGSEAPSPESLFLAARSFVETLRPDVSHLYGPGDNYNALNNLASEADAYLRDDSLKTVCAFSAALMAITRYMPVRR